MTPEQKEWIDTTPYVELLRRWRFAPAGDSLFQGDTGKYYSEVMFRKRNEVDHVAASKLVGWDR